MSTAETLITKHLDTWTSAIKAKSSAGRGGGKKQEFYGLKKLRELILELAVRGLLVPQDSRDEPVSALLKRIAKKQTALIDEGVVKKQNAMAPVSDAETPFKLPKGWRWVRLSDVAYPQAGFAFKSDGFNEVEHGLPLVRIRDVGQPFTGTYFDGEFREEFMVNRGDYLISMDGNFRVASWELGQALLNQRVTRLVFFGDEHSRKFCAISLQLRLSELQGVKAYTTVDHLSGKQIAESVIGFPPLAEQHRIVAKVDDLMTLCDQLEQKQEESKRTHATLVQTLLGTLTAASERGAFAEAWHRIAAHFDTLFTTESSIDQLKQTILQLAVMGKLVKQDPEDEPASKLIQLIAKDRATAIKAKQMRKPKAIDPYEGDFPFELPSTWTWSQLGQLVAPEDNAICDGPFGSKLKTEHYIDERGFAVIRLGNIGIGDFIWGKEGYITKAHFESLPGNHTIPGDLIVAGMAEPLVRCCEVPPELGPAINKADCFRVRLHSGLNRSYVRHFFNSPVAKLLAGEENHGMTRQRINLGNAKALPIPIPPLNEQKLIVAKVDELMSLCDRLKARLQTAQTTQLHLADTLVEAAIH